jgi:hypothetical protein
MEDLRTSPPKAIARPAYPDKTDGAVRAQRVAWYPGSEYLELRKEMSEKPVFLRV